MFCLPLSLRTSRECTTTKDILVSCSNSFGCSLVALLPRVVVTGSQNKRGYALSFYTYINRIFDLQCEPVSRIRSRRKVRPSQTYSLRNRLHLLISCRKSSSSNFYRAISRTLSRPRNSTVRQYPLSRNGATTSCPAATLPCTTCRPNSTLSKTFTGNVKENDHGNTEIQYKRNTDGNHRCGHEALFFQRFARRELVSRKQHRR